MTRRIVLVKDSDIQLTRRVSDIYVAPHAGESVSSMTEQHREMFRLYDDIPNLSVAYLEEGGVILGRVLIWDDCWLEGKPEKFRGFSRIYAVSPEIETMLRGWCKDRGMTDLYTIVRGKHSPTIFVNVGIEFVPDMYVAVPYVDCVPWIAEGFPYMSSHPMKTDRRLACLQNCEGQGDWLTGEDKIYCSYCGERPDPQEKVLLLPDGGILCKWCVKERTTTAREAAYL